MIWYKTLISSLLEFFIIAMYPYKLNTKYNSKHSYQQAFNMTYCKYDTL